MPVGAGAEEEGLVARRLVHACELGELALHLLLGLVHRQAFDGAGKARGGGHVDEQVVDRAGADHAQHRLPVGGLEGEITHQEGFLIEKRRRT